MNYAEMNKPALVDLVVGRELLKTKTAARRTEKAELIRLLDVDDIKRRGAERKAEREDQPGPIIPGTLQTLQRSVPSTIPAPPDLEAPVSPEEHATNLAYFKQRSEVHGLVPHTSGGQARSEAPSVPVDYTIDRDGVVHDHRPKPRPLAMPEPAPKRHPHGATSPAEVQRARQAKRARNRRKYRRALARRRHGWANGQTGAQT